MMLTGAAIGFIVAGQARSVSVGVAAAMAAAGVMALVLAYYSVDLRGSQITVGLGLFVLGIGLSSLLYRVVFGVRLTPPRLTTLPVLVVPGLADIPVAGPILFRPNVMVHPAPLPVPAVPPVLFKPPLGLRLRAAGENPRAVDTLGIDVFALRRTATVVGGLFIGAAGAYLPIALTGTFNDNMTAGRGWLALMLVIFGRLRPGWGLLGALLFAWVESLQFKPAMGTKLVPPPFLLMLPDPLPVGVLGWILPRAKAPAPSPMAYRP